MDAPLYNTMFFLIGIVVVHKMNTVALFCAMAAIVVMVSAEEPANYLVKIIIF